MGYSVSDARNKEGIGRIT